MADGIEKPIEVVNRLFPGPSIQVCRGDTVVVNVFNMLRSSRVTSIHWHGQRLKGNPYMDGVSMVSQCPILPFTSFQYQYQANDGGTHFWHSSTGVQRSV
jgi:L-ascorbate oxidase